MTFLVVFHWPTYRVVESSIFLGVLVGTFLIPLVIQTYHHVKIWQAKYKIKHKVNQRVTEKSK